MIVPEFGGFIANYRSAVVDTANKRILPPSKSVLFNVNLKNNDGLLANTLVQAEDYSYPKALEVIQKSVANWLSELSEGKRLDFGELGFLYQQENSIIFEQSREVNLLLEAYGLSNVKFVPHLKTVEKEPVKNVVADKVSTPPKKKIEIVETPVIALTEKEDIVVNTSTESEDKVVSIQKTKRGGKWKYIAAAVAIPFLFYSYWIPAETDFIETGKIQLADFNPIHSAPERSYEVRLENEFHGAENPKVETWESLTSQISEHVEVYNYALDDDFYIPIRLEKNQSEKIEASEKVIAQNKDLPYHIIGGCFSIASNADQLVEDLQKAGYEAHVLDKKNGLHRVSSGDYATRSEAKAALKAFRNAGFSGWVLKK